MFASRVLQFHSQALQSLSSLALIWLSFDNGLESWPKEREKHSRNYPIIGHTDQFVERKQLKIYKEKKTKWGVEEVAIYQGLLELHIITKNNWKFIKRKKRWGGCNLPVTIRIPYNNDIWRVWANGETHSKVGNRVTLAFKEMLNKCLLVNKKN